MNRNLIWLSIAFAASVLAVGIPYWAIPYGRRSLPNALMGSALFVVALTAFLLCACNVASFRRVTLLQAASAPTVVLSRVLMDALQDPTSHNLWPLEAVIALGMGLVGASAGALAGSLVAYCVRTVTRARIRTTRSVPIDEPESRTA